MYGLNHSGRMWYNHLTESHLDGCVNNVICSCLFIKNTKMGFNIIVVYVDDLKIIGTPYELHETVEYWKRECQIKDLGNKTLPWVSS